MSTATVAADTQQDTSAIVALIEGLARAHHTKTVAEVAACYVPGAAIFNLAPPLVHRGIDAEEKQAWFDTWDGPIEIEPKDFEITVAGDTAFCHGYMRMTGRKKGADHFINFWMRETICLQRSGGGWRIVHEHASVPFYMDASLRPAFDLQP